MKSPTSAVFKLRFRENQLERWATTYDYAGESRIVDELAPVARARGYLVRDEFVELARWKSPRPKQLIERNDADLVEKVTRAALSSDREEIRIGLLQILNGVSWPMASVILHFCSTDDYPILDFRALWTLGYSRPPVYGFPFWWDYTTFVRALKQRSGLDMRTIDRALWAYSAAKQPAGV